MQKKKAVAIIMFVLWFIIMVIAIIFFMNNTSSDQQKPTIALLTLDITEIELDADKIDEIERIDEILNVKLEDYNLELRIEEGQDVIALLNLIVETEIFDFNHETELVDFLHEGKALDLVNGQLNMPDDNLTLKVITRERKYVQLEIYIDLEDITYNDGAVLTDDILERSNIYDFLWDMVESLNIQRPGFRIIGFIDYSNQNIINEDTIIPHNGMTIIIKWQYTHYNVTINLGNGTFDTGSSAGENSTNFKVETTKNLYEHIADKIEKGELKFSKEGYRFIGWTINGIPFTPDYNEDMELGRNVYLEAIWKSKYFHIIIELHGGTITSDHDESFRFDNSENLYEYITSNLEVEKTGHEFIGWTINDNKFDENYRSHISSQRDITLVAVWEMTHFNVVLNFNGGHLAGTNATEFEFLHNKEDNLYEYIRNLHLTIIRNAYRFDRWTFEGADFTSSYRTDLNFEGDITLDAQWEIAGTITINDGENMFVLPNADGEYTTSNSMIISGLLLGTNIVDILSGFIEAVNGLTGLDVEKITLPIGEGSVRRHNGYIVRVLDDRQIIGFSLDNNNVNFLYQNEFSNWIIDADSRNIIVNAIVLNNITDITSWQTREVILEDPRGGLINGLEITGRNQTSSGDIVMPTFIEGRKVIRLGDNALGADLAPITSIILPKYLIYVGSLVSGADHRPRTTTIDLTNMPLLRRIPVNFARTNNGGPNQNNLTVHLNPISILNDIARGSFQSNQHTTINITIRLFGFDENNFHGNDTTWWGHRNNFNQPAVVGAQSNMNAFFGNTNNRVNGW